MRSPDLYCYFYCTRNALTKLSLFMMLLFLVSCEDMLEEKPKTVAAETFYNTEEEVETAVNAIYLPFHNSTWPELIVRLDTHTDWGYGRGSRSVLNNLQGFTSIDEMSSYWGNFYLIIRNANLVIKNVSNGTTISQEKVDLCTGEARFLRALAYFNLVRNYGGIPLRTEENMETRDLGKTAIADIYTFIVQDLIYAEAKLPNQPAKAGRPGKYAAKTLLADVYLTLGEYAKARDKANEVIESNQYSLVPVTTKEDFQSKVFGPEIVTSPEEIFYIKYMRQPGYGNYILWILNHVSTGYFNYGGAYAHYGMSTNPFFQNWPSSDIRKNLWTLVNFGLGSNTLVCNKYTDKQAVEASLGAGNDLPLYRYADALLIYAEASCMADNAPTAQGLEALNQVHRRAYGANPNIASPADFKLSDYDVVSFRNLVLQERAYEFIFEGKRWYDLKRTGKAAEVILAAKGATIAEKAYLWPIPTSELNYNQALDPEVDQNPGY